jgi:hypothetical protein
MVGKARGKRNALKQLKKHEVKKVKRKLILPIPPASA